MKNIIVSDEVVEMIDRLGIYYDEGNIQYKDNVWHILPVITGILVGCILMSGLAIQMALRCDRVEDTDPTPTLTGEYGQPDGWETLTGPYVE